MGDTGDGGGKWREDGFEFRLLVEYSRCYGSCPPYVLALGSDGRLAVWGRDWIGRTRAWQFDVESSVVSKLRLAVLQVPWESLRTDYAPFRPGCEANETDAPWNVVQLDTLHGSRHVSIYRGCIPRDADVDVYAAVTYLLDLIAALVPSECLDVLRPQ